MDSDVTFWTAHQQLEALRSGAISARELLHAHEARIEEVNPTVNAVVTLDLDRARRVAAVVDARHAAGEQPGPLEGLPVAFKDTHAVAGMRSTSGSPLRAHVVPDRDEEIVARLRRAGVVGMGKTNVPEFAAGSHTYNRLFGVTTNPYDPTRSAGGSSGGAAAALAAGMQPLADGSDMGGSLRNPASFCNVVGLRPTPGRVPDPGAPLPFSSLAVGGPMARTVHDVALMLSVIAGPHPHEPLSLAADASLAHVPTLSLHGLRVAWAPTLGGRVPVDVEVLDVLEPAVRVFEEAGAHVELACPPLDDADHVFRTLRAAEFDLYFADELAREPEGFLPDLADNIRAGARTSGRELTCALAQLARLQRDASTFFTTYDVLLAPVSQVAPFPVTTTWPRTVAGVAQHTYLDWMAASYLITTLGVPALSLPAGFTPDGLPVGLQVITAARTERRLLGVGAAFESMTGHGLRRPASVVQSRDR